MSAGLAGRHALVTGAGRGLGRACALALAESGASLTLMARTATELEAVAEAAGGAQTVVGDVTDPDAVDAAVALASAHGDRLWACVTAAGFNRPGPSADYPLADWDLIIDVNVRGTFLACRAFGAALLRAGTGGRIVTMSSQMGTVGYPGRAAYCASKHAVNGLTKALAVEWAPSGVTVNAVAPTFVETPLTRPMLADPAFREDVLRRIPLGRLGTVEEVAAAVTFLASDAAGLVTGQILGVDGGWTAW